VLGLVLGWVRMQVLDIDRSEVYSTLKTLSFSFFLLFFPKIYSTLLEFTLNFLCIITSCIYLALLPLLSSPCIYFPTYHAYR